jgi:dTDP-4-amino-4,6-dideoxygalactose transaminase
MSIPFNQPFLAGDELRNLSECLAGGSLAGDGRFTAACHAWLKAHYGCPEALLTHSCTAALEMAAILTEIEPGDEVIMPSYTFVSTANAFVLRGAVPVFVDVRSDTMNLDEGLLEQALTSRTRAVVPVHYAGVACAMDEILEFSARHGLMVVEDAAQAYLATYKGRPLGTLGVLGALSFHETKNIISGEGGALLINDKRFDERAHIIREKGTNRTQFLRREVAKYEWLDIGSSFLPSELIAAVLLAQLEQSVSIIARRLAVWQRYHQALAPLEQAERLRRPVIPAEAEHNAHIYPILLPDAVTLRRLREALRERGVMTATHYVPLHSAPAGRRFGRVAGSTAVTDRVAGTLLRLPLYAEMTEANVDRVVGAVTEVLME